MLYVNLSAGLFVLPFFLFSAFAGQLAEKFEKSRIRTKVLDNIPDEGAAIVTCDHVSFVDALILGGTIRRPVRFVMYHRIFKIPVLNFIFRTARTIPIAPMKEDEALLKKPTRTSTARCITASWWVFFPRAA